MSVVAKFFVQNITPPAEGTSGGTQVSLSAVCRGAANSEWASATPAGYIQMTIRNDRATEQFVQGKEYEVVFREVETPKEGDGHAVQATHPSWAPDTWFCGVCGQYPDGQVYGVKVEDPATLDWSTHDEHFKKALDTSDAAS